MMIRLELVRTDDEAEAGLSYEDVFAGYWPADRPVEFSVDRAAYTEDFVIGACWVEVRGDRADLAAFLEAYHSADGCSIADWPDYDSNDPSDYEVTE
jgi:hypothetical protein